MFRVCYNDFSQRNLVFSFTGTGAQSTDRNAHSETRRPLPIRQNYKHKSKRILNFTKLGILIALAAAVNSPEAPMTPVSSIGSQQIQTVVRGEHRAAGDTLEEVVLWNGRIASSSVALAAEEPEKAVVHEPKPRTQAKATLAVGSSEVEARVKAYFADIPIMAEVARCESRFRHIDVRTGEVLRGEINYLDRGVMQINEGYHGDTAVRLGFDLMTLEGNMAYARYLYEKQGTQPWVSSSPCWGAAAQGEIAQK